MHMYVYDYISVNLLHIYVCRVIDPYTLPQALRECTLNPEVWFQITEKPEMVLHVNRLDCTATNEHVR